MRKIDWKITVTGGNVYPKDVTKAVISEFGKHGFEIKSSDFGRMKQRKDNTVCSASLRLKNKYARIIFKTVGCFEQNGVTYKLDPYNKFSNFLCYIDFTDHLDVTAEEMDDYLMFECGVFYKGNAKLYEKNNSFSVFFFDELEAYMFMKNHKSIHGREFKVSPKDGWSSNVEEEYQKFIKRVTNDYIVPEESIDDLKKPIPELYKVSIDAATFLKKKKINK